MAVISFCKLLRFYTEEYLDKCVWAISEARLYTVFLIEILKMFEEVKSNYKARVKEERFPDDWKKTDYILCLKNIYDYLRSDILMGKSESELCGKYFKKIYENLLNENAFNNENSVLQNRQDGKKPEKVS